MAGPFTMQQKVMFKHCDPAGIVFFPRYFEMMNDCVETFFDDALGEPFESLHLSHAVPTAAIASEFRAPSKLGDMLTLHLVTARVGRTSWRYRMSATCADEPRFETDATLVHVDAAGRPVAWPPALRDKLKDYEARECPMK